MKRGLLILTFVSIIVLGGLHQVANAFFLYWNSVWFDTFMHFLGGFSLATLFVWFLYRWGFTLGRRKILLLAIIFVLAVSVAWEIFEYYFGIANPVGESYAEDTTYDFVWAALGSLFGSWLATTKKLLS